MKKQLPMPLVIGIIAVVVVLGGFAIFKAVQGPGELPAPKIKVGDKAVPDYVKGMSPEMQKMVEEQTKKYGTK
jgi:hypothetical protein